MDVGRIKGAGGFERPGRPGRPGGVDGKGPHKGAARLDANDSATISVAGKETLASVEAHTSRLRTEPSLREDRIAEMRAKLEQGELDRPEVYRAVAEKLLGAAI